MSPYSGLLFFGILILVLLPAVFLGMRGKSLRSYGMAATVLMLLIMFDNWQTRCCLLAFWVLQTALCFGYLALRKRCTRQWHLWAAIGLSLLPLLLVKLGDLIPALRGFSLLGVSYMTFRAVQILIEIYDGHIKSLSLLDLSYFLLFFPSVASGPVDRYRRFVGDLQKQRSSDAYYELLKQGVWKLMVGAVYNFAIGNLIWSFWIEKLLDSGFLATWSYLYGYTLFMFFNFAGYSRMAIGTAYILGIQLPENFNMPFLSKDMKDFWARWHISLSTWLRDHVYTRFCMAALRGSWFKSKRTSSYLGYLLTMVLMGVWHGFNLSCLVYGLYHGLLMGLNDVLDTKWKRFKKLKKQPLAGAVMTVITFHLFGFGLLIFSGRLF